VKAVRPAASHLAGLEPYDPAYLPARIYLNANENPYGLPLEVRKELAEKLGTLGLHRYPSPLAAELRAALAQRDGVAEDCVLLGNGGDELLFDLMLAYGGPGRTLLTAPPTFSVYAADARLTHTRVFEVPLMGDAAGAQAPLPWQIDEQAVLDAVRGGGIDLVMLTSPNNPTGGCVRPGFLLELLAATDALVVVDHAYLEFANARFDMTQHLAAHDNLVILRTFSKAYALAGVRLGYLLASVPVVAELLKVRQPYSVDAFSELAGLTVLAHHGQLHATVEAIVTERARLANGLARIHSVLAYPSEANYVLTRVPGAHEVWQRLYHDHGILVRDFSRAPLLEDCLRITVGTPQEDDALLAALGQIVG